MIGFRHKFHGSNLTLKQMNKSEFIKALKRTYAQKSKCECYTSAH